MGTFIKSNLTINEVIVHETTYHWMIFISLNWLLLLPLLFSTDF